MKEASILPAIDAWLAQLFDDDHIGVTCAALEASMGPDPSEEARLGSARRRIRECEHQVGPISLGPGGWHLPLDHHGWIGIVGVLASARAERRHAVYQQLNVAIDCRNDRRLRITAGVACTNECVGGANLTLSTRDPWEAWLAAA